MGKVAFFQPSVIDSFDGLIFPPTLLFYTHQSLSCIKDKLLSYSSAFYFLIPSIAEELVRLLDQVSGISLNAWTPVNYEVVLVLL